MSIGEHRGWPSHDRERDRPAGDPAAPVPVAPDRPVVAGEQMSPEELRAEVTEQSDERRQQVDELRDEVSATVGELVTRLDLRDRARARCEEIARAVRARAVTPRPAVLVVAGTVVLVVLVRIARSRNRPITGA